MRRYTTPTHDLVVEGIDLTGMDVWVTYRQDGRRLVKMGPDELESVTYDEDADESTITVSLTQLQTAQFAVGKRAKVQVNFIDSEDRRNATVIKEITISENLLDEVVEYGM